MKKIYLLLLAVLFVITVSVNAQPGAMSINQDVSGTYANSGMSLQGGAFRARFQENGTGASSGVRNWQFNADGYFNQWGTTAAAGIQVLAGFNQVILPNTATASANWYTTGYNSNGRLPATQANFYYTYNIMRGTSYAGQRMSILETSYNPVSVNTVTQSAGTFGSLNVNITTSATPASGENIFVRYSTNSFTSSTIILASGSVTSWTANIPGQSAVVSYYVYTSNRTKAQIDGDVTTFSTQEVHDLSTLNLNNNIGSNYSWTPPGIFSSAAAGPNNWNSAASWVVTSGYDADGIPDSDDDVFIESGHTVTVNAAAANCKSLQINSGGELSVSGNTLTVGFTNNNNFLNTDGTLTVSGGTLNINGNLAINAGATFNHSSGNINVDGNANGVAGNSVITTTPLVNFVSNNLNLTGGTLTIIDPHQADNAYSLQYNNSTAHVNLPTTYTIRFGDGISTHQGGSTGFYLNTSQGTRGLALGNVIIEGSSSGIRRNVTLFSNVCISGDITINGATGELLIQAGNTLHAGGNITVNSGAFLKNFGSGVLALQSFTNETVAANTVAQTIGGSGTFSDNVTPTANFQRLTINNSSAGGVTFSNDVQVSGILTMVTGKAIMSGPTQTMTLGFSTGTQGSLTHTGGYIVGKFKRWINGTGSRQFPVGFGANLKNAVINFTGAPSTGGTLTAQWINASPGFPNALPLMEGAITINAAGFGYWLIDAADGLTGGTYTGTFTNNGATLGNYLNTALIKRPTAGGDWTLDGTHVTTSGSNTNPVFQRTGMSGFSQFGFGGTASTLPVNIISFSGYKEGSRNQLRWTTATEINNKGFDLQRSTDAITYSSIAFVNSLANGGNSDRQLNYTFTDNSVSGDKQYYRLRQEDLDGRSKLSNIVLINGAKPVTVAIDGLFPNPASSVVNVLVAVPERNRLTLLVTDMAGHTLSQKLVSAETGSNTIQLDVSSLASGTYMVRVVCEDGCQPVPAKFVKQ